MAMQQEDHEKQESAQQDPGQKKPRSRARRGRGEGGVFRRSDGRWVGSLSLGFDEQGKRKRRVVYGASKREVQEELRKLQGDADAGLLSDAGRLTVGEYLERWLNTTAKNKVRPTTHARYEQIVRLHLKPALGGIRLGKLRLIHVEQLYAQMEKDGATAWTRKMSGVTLTNALRHAVRVKLIPYNPAADVVKARPEDKEMLYFTEAQTRFFLNVARDNRLYGLFALAVGSGMRQGELLGLQWPDIDFDKGTLAVRRSLAQLKKEFVLKEPKSKRSRRIITLPRFVLDTLIQHRAKMLAEGQDVHGGTVFVTRNGTYIAKSNLIRHSFKPIIKAANKKATEEAEKKQLRPELLPELRFHDLRHTHATALLNRGHSIKAVSQRLGHASIELTLKVYAHVLPTDDGVLADHLERMFG
jgi:integrase